MTGHVTFGGQCGECSSCGKCRKMLECNNIVIKEDSKETKTMEQDQSRKTIHFYHLFRKCARRIVTDNSRVHTKASQHRITERMCILNTWSSQIHHYSLL